MRWVQLVPAATPWVAGRMTKSDSLGRFRVDSVPPGRYLFGFQHPRLDSLGLDGVTRTIDLDKAVRVIRADLAVPSGRTFVSSLCGPNSDSTGAVHGPRDECRGWRADRWRVPSSSATPRCASMAPACAVCLCRSSRSSVPDGKYVACGLPDRRPRRRAGARRCGDRRHEPRHQRRGRTHLPAEGCRSCTATSSWCCAPPPPLAQRRGAAPVARVRRAAPYWHGAPERTRRRRRWHAGRWRARQRSGHRHPGRRRQRRPRSSSVACPRARAAWRSWRSATRRPASPADLRPNRDATVSVNVGARMSTLSTVKVTGAPVDRSGFLGRRAQGMGFFMDAAAIEARGLQSVASTLTTVPGPARQRVQQE